MRKVLLILVIFVLPIICMSCVFSNVKEHKDWETYQDKIFNFSIQYSKNWEIGFWKTAKDIKSLPSQNFGWLEYIGNDLKINFDVYPADKGENLEHFTRKSANEDIYFKENKVLNKISIIRIGAHFHLEDGEYYELNQVIKIKDYLLSINAELTKESIEKKDDKYKKVIEIMDTFKVL